MIFTNRDDHGIWIADTNPFIVGRDVCISRTDDEGRLLGGVIYQQFNHRSIIIHVRADDPHWLNRDMLWAIFDYPFNRLGVEQILGFVATTNPKALAFDLHIGFTEVTRIPNAVIGGDYVVISMYRKDCRWLNIKPRTLAPRLPTLM